MSKPKVMVTRRWPKAVEAAMADKFETVFNSLTRPPSVAELKDALSNSDALLTTGTDVLPAAFFEKGATRTKLIASCSADISHIDVDAAINRGITVTHSPDVLSGQIADSAIMLMLMMARRGTMADQGMSNNASSHKLSVCPAGSSIAGKTLGLIGFGQVGQAVARRAHHGFGMRILVYSSSPVDQDVASALGVEQFASIDDLLPHAAFVSLHCNGGVDNHHLINAHRLNLMKPNAFLINTAHGELVDEQALVHALWFETIGGAGLGVCLRELQRLPELRACDNAIVLPHAGDAALETREATGFRTVDNIVDFFEGRSPRDQV